MFFLLLLFPTKFQKLATISTLRLKKRASENMFVIMIRDFLFICMYSVNLINILTICFSYSKPFDRIQ